MTSEFQTAGSAVAEPEVVTGEIVGTKELTKIKDERKAELSEIVESAMCITVEDAEDAAGATEVLTEIARRKKALEAERKKLVTPINAAKDAVQNLFNGLKAPLDEARSILEPKVIAYQEAEEKRIAAENAEREREAFEKQQAEAKRIEAEKAEAQRKASEAVKAARAASAAMAEKPDPEAEAKALAAAEAARQAEEELSAKRSEIPTMGVVEREEAKATVKTTSGSFTVKKVWTAEVIDESQVPREYLIVDQKKLNAVVKAGVRAIPGVKIYEKSEGAVRA